jgi:hypothetical protein
MDGPQCWRGAQLHQRNFSPWCKMIWFPNHPASSQVTVVTELTAPLRSRPPSSERGRWLDSCMRPPFHSQITSPLYPLGPGPQNHCWRHDGKVAQECRDLNSDPTPSTLSVTCRLGIAAGLWDLRFSRRWVFRVGTFCIIVDCSDVSGQFSVSFFII